ncbi:hypothetical protein [Streptomyces chartreusis]
MGFSGESRERSDACVTRMLHMGATPTSTGHGSLPSHPARVPP